MITKTFYLHSIPDPQDERFYISDTADMSRAGWVLLSEQNITFQQPDIHDLREKQVAAMRKAQEHLRATTQVQINAIEETIQSFLALPSA